MLDRAIISSLVLDSPLEGRCRWQRESGQNICACVRSIPAQNPSLCCG
ncbi:hypothetical protein CCHR01_07621 [Colletotrichum chrysophilum]|uniref:Uncharacterized protein n=1 Tax=Colletotrichum chrysophilum TaxID=1836956 RepID=A0AAD9EFR3_9PEZI|nr:hypothetical protein CCHR01_07621 [Colletotrichum chrysophilum]